MLTSTTSPSRWDWRGTSDVITHRHLGRQGRLGNALFELAGTIALGLIMGQKADAGVVRTGSARADADGEWRLDPDSASAAIARDIARFHGGDVVLESSPLGGLRARVWLPV